MLQRHAFRQTAWLTSVLTKCDQVCFMSCVDNVQSKHKHKTAAVILPVRVGNEGVALESSFKEGVKNEVLRSLCQLVNTTELALEVSLDPFQAVTLLLSWSRLLAKLCSTQIKAFL